MDKRDCVSSSREIPKILIFLILKVIFRPWKLNWDVGRKVGGVAMLHVTLNPAEP